ncbi:MAG: PEP-CTERM sorting domain-containing protein [Verrucomicrobiales bacterium]|jgi:hypothetical protein|nr:PEP-CTERM sorting domain-containing protein [Verrucomicrobiales bacterium]
MKNINRILKWLVGGIVCLSISASAWAEVIYHIVNEPSGYSSFAYGGGNTQYTNAWSDGNSPASGNDYVNDDASMAFRTPFLGTNYIFAGNSLTITNDANLTIKAGSNGTLTVNDFRLDNGTLMMGAQAYGSNVAVTTTWAGTTTIINTATITFNTGNVGGNAPTVDNTKETLLMSADIVGDGLLVVSHLAGATSAAQGTNFIVNFSGNNSYSGGTILTAPGTNRANNGLYNQLNVEVVTSLGTGDVWLNAGNGAMSLSLQNNTAIYEDAFLYINTANQTNWTLNLDYEDAMNIAGIWFDSTLYDGSAGFTYEDLLGESTFSSHVFGTGVFNLGQIPEPSALILLGLGTATLGLLRWRRKH